MKKDKFFLVADNGAYMRYQGYYPYWKKYNCWNLHYGWRDAE
ncbi:MAG: hypothetical protein ACI392_04125 [Paludibacteraceae bacterium]